MEMFSGVENERVMTHVENDDGVKVNVKEIYTNGDDDEMISQSHSDTYLTDWLTDTDCGLWRAKWRE